MEVEDSVPPKEVELEPLFVTADPVFEEPTQRQYVQQQNPEKYAPVPFQ